MNRHVQMWWCCHVLETTRWVIREERKSIAMRASPASWDQVFIAMGLQ